MTIYWNIIRLKTSRAIVFANIGTGDNLTGRLGKWNQWVLFTYFEQDNRRVHKILDRCIGGGGGSPVFGCKYFYTCSDFV